MLNYSVAELRIKTIPRKCLFSKLFIIFVGSLRGLTYFDESVSLLSCAENLVNLK